MKNRKVILVCGFMLTAILAGCAKGASGKEPVGQEASGIEVEVQEADGKNSESETSEESEASEESETSEAVKDAEYSAEELQYFEEDGKYGFKDADGNVAFTLTCDSVSSFYEGIAYICVDGKYQYIDQQGQIADPTEEQVSALWEQCQNGNAEEYITPNKTWFYDLTKEPVEHDYIYDQTIDETWRYYKIGEELFLYYYAKPVDWDALALSEGALYVYDGEQVQQVLQAGECGGSMGGDVICLLKDIETNEVLIGTEWHAGGFGGNAYGKNAYRYENSELTTVCAFEAVNQTIYNYDESELIENAELFYDENGNTLTKDTILEKDFVTEYTVNDEMVTAESYDEIEKRYETIEKFW